MEPLPDAGRLPIAEAPPAGRAAPAAEFLGQQPPRAPGPEHEDDAAEGGAIRDAGAAASRLRGFFGQQRLDGFPEVVGDKGVAHSGDVVRRPLGFCNAL
jgi:hypothetical protein